MTRRSPAAALAALVVGAASALGPAPVRAAGFYLGDVGAEAQARGGAFVAAPASVLAVHYNPAGLSLLDGLHVAVDVSVVDLEASFRRRCPCVDPGFGDPATRRAVEAQLEGVFADNQASTRTPLVVPFLGAAYGFGPVSVALAVYGPTSGRFDYGGLGPASDPRFVERARRKVTRYNALEAPNLELNYALGLAFEPQPGLRVGVGYYLHQTGARQSLHLFADTAFADGPEDPSWDVPVLLDFLSDPALNWGLGVSWDVPWVKGLTVGASYRAERSVEARGTITVDLPADLVGVATVEGDAVDVRLSIAPLARLGVQYRQPGRFSIEAAAVWEGWSVNDRILLRPEGIGFRIGDLEPVGLDEIVSERNWRDTASVRLGGSLELWQPWLTLQGGWFFEPSAVPRRWLDPSRIDLDKHGFALGAGAEWRGVKVQLAATYVTMQGVTVEDSRARNAAPLGFAPELRTTVGNGDYAGQALIGTLGLGFSLDAFSEAR